MKASPLCLLSLVCALLAVLFGSAGAVDLDADGVNDVWRLWYQAQALPPGGDADGDGLTNRVEAIAATNPFLPTETFAITNIVKGGVAVTLRWAGRADKTYRVQASATLLVNDWTNVGAPLAGSEGEMVTSAPASGPSAFFRVLVEDLDTDGDGLSDWEERRLGLSTVLTHSGGLGQPGDFAVALQRLQSGNVVTVAPLDPVGAEDGAVAGTFLVTRSGNVQALSVNYALSGSASAGTDYAAPGLSVAIPFAATSAVVTVTPVPDGLREAREAAVMTLLPGTGYTLGAATTAAVFIDDAEGAGLRGQYWNTSAATPTTTTTVPPLATRVDPTVSFSWPASPAAGVNADYFFVRWTGEVRAKATSDWTFATQGSTGARLWVNGQLLVNNWPPTTPVATEVASATTVPLQGGERYPIVLEHYSTTGTAGANLRWWSPAQPVEIIPANHLYADSMAPWVESDRVVWLLGSGPLSYQVRGAAAGSTYTAIGLPEGLTLNPATGLITGTPTTAGTYSSTITATGNGSGSASVVWEIIGAGNALTREVWTSAGSETLATFPWNSAPTSTGTVPLAQSPSEVGDGYAARLRGYVHAPVTGAYRFWIAASAQAELWIGNDEEPGTLNRRAFVATPTLPAEWNASATQQSALLWLEAGHRYYLEARHLAGTGSDHLAVGWLRPGQAGTAPSEVIPGYTLSPWQPPPSAAPTGGTLYLTTLTPQAGAVSGGSGTASVQISVDETYAVVRVAWQNLTTARIAMHVHDGPSGGLIVCDLDTAPELADGSYLWQIAPAGGLTAAQIVQSLKDGNSYVNVHTVSYPGGEISGYLRLTAASQIFTPPPAPPSWTDDHTDANAASRFLAQATFGATWPEIAQVQSMGYAAWIDNQLSLPASSLLSLIDEWMALYPTTSPPTSPPAGSTVGWLAGESYSFAWWKRSITAPDQLRQRLAFALSEVLVCSGTGVIFSGNRPPIVIGRHEALATYYDALLTQQNFRGVLEQVTLNQGMGQFLDMIANEKGNVRSGLAANENYARELLQLFSIGLNRLHPDGSLILSSQGQPIPNYDQSDIVGTAKVLTGWNFDQPNQANGQLPTTWFAVNNVPVAPNNTCFRLPMKLVPTRHDPGAKRIMDRIYLPGLPSTVSPADVGNPAYQGLGGGELSALLDAVFQHPSLGPFLCRQLIQRLVSSHPSPGYIYRAARVFDNNGSGVRGDLHAVVKAILLDYEARSTAVLAQQGYGKQREPLMRVTNLARPFLSTTTPSSYFLAYFKFVGSVASWDIGQSPMYAPSVFNYFLPDYTHSGLLATAGLTTPEFQLTSETTAIGASNAVYLGTPGFTTTGGVATIAYDFASIDALTGNPTALVDHLNTLLMAGQMSAAMRTEIITYLGNLNVSSRRAVAVRMIVRSPEYLIQR